MGWLIKNLKAHVICDRCGEKVTVELRSFTVMNIAIAIGKDVRTKRALKRKGWHYINSKCFCPKCTAGHYRTTTSNRR